MIQKNPFLKYMMKDKKKDVFHSSAYAKAQSGETIGVASTESFKVRANIDQNRQMVRGYRDSRVITDASKNAPRAKVYVESEQNGMSGISNSSGGVGDTGVDNGRVGDVRVGSAVGRRSNDDSASRNEVRLGSKINVARGERSGGVAARKPVMPIRPGIFIKK